MTTARKNTILFILAVAGLLSLLLSPFLLWIVKCYNESASFSLSAIASFHSRHPLYYVVDAFSLLLLFSVISFGYLIKKWKEELKEKISRQAMNMENIRIFSEKIGKGELDAEFKSSNGASSVESALIVMRDNLRNSSQDEKNRQWTMEGIARLGDILMKNSRLPELGYDVIVFLIHKINAIQGAFYLIEEDIVSGKSKIVMAACYAYNRKKYRQKEFKPGEGLVGQAAIERDYIYCTEIPADYVSITSGILGDRKPNSLLIVPLIANETLHGVVEIASLNKMNSLEINFVKEAAKIIAQTIFNQSVNAKTSRLLEEVSHSQKRMQVLLENASEVISIYDVNRKVKYESPSVIKILGYTPEEMLGDTDFSRIHPKGRTTIDKLFSDLIAFPKEQITVEVSYNKKNGERIWLETTGRNLLSDPAIQGIILNSRDITMRRKAEKEEKMRGQMQALSENSLDLIMRINTKGIFYYINPVIESFTGEKPSRYIQKSIQEVAMDPDFSGLLFKIIGNVPSSREKYSTETEYISAGRKRILSVNAIPEFNNENEVETILIVAHDITEAKINEQKISETNKKITESINYAERIQKAMLPNEKYLAQHFNDCFMFYEPKDVVSGDFPWLYEKEDGIYVATVDCTGHGVPGAFMSLIGNFLLNQNISSSNLPESSLSPSVILDCLHEGVKKTLKQDENMETRDGMDIALCKIDMKQRKMEYAGAHRPLYVVRNSEIIEVRGDRYPIGGNQYRNRKCFTNHTLPLQQNDVIYFFTDGLPDQIGGPEGKKFNTTKIKEIIRNCNNRSMREMHRVISNEYRQWKNGYKQIDDVLMIGIRIS